jgi:hypothetical protein
MTLDDVESLKQQALKQINEMIAKMKPYCN